MFPHNRVSVRIYLTHCTRSLALYFKGLYSILFFNGSAINIRGTGIRLLVDNIRGMKLSGLRILMAGPLKNKIESEPLKYRSNGPV